MTDADAPAAPAAAVPSSAAAAAAAAVPSSTEHEIGWLRAIVSGLVILVVGIGGAVYGADSILSDALGLRRTPREWLAVALFFVVLLALAWVLRRLQSRKLI